MKKRNKEGLMVDTPMFVCIIHTDCISSTIMMENLEREGEINVWLETEDER